MSLLVFTALLCYTGLIVWLWRGWQKLRRPDSRALPVVSVIVAAHNEAANLPGLFKALAGQSYPEQLREFIVIDDRSSDATPAVLQEWQPILSLHCLRIDAVPPGINPKKWALDAAIREARGEVIVTTDADCVPPEQWLHGMAEAFDNDVGAVVGISPWHAGEGLWGGIIALESLANAMVALAGVGHGRPFLAFGRSFAFRRELFARVGGFDGDLHLFSGDDDLLLQKIAALPACRIVAVDDPVSQVPSRGAGNLRAFIRQKRRHISAGRAYSRRPQIGYAVYHLSNFLLWASPLLLGLPGFGFLFSKLLLDAVLMHRAARRWSWQVSWLAFLPWQAFFVLVHSLVGPTAFAGRVHWKS